MPLKTGNRSKGPSYCCGEHIQDTSWAILQKGALLLGEAFSSKARVTLSPEEFWS